MAEVLARKRRIRTGHKALATKMLHQVEEITDSEGEVDKTIAAKAILPLHLVKFIPFYGFFKLSCSRSAMCFNVDS